MADGDYLPEDLDGLEVDDFEDPEYFYSEDEDDIDDEEMPPGPEVLFELFNTFLQYDDQNIVETLCQVRDSIDANSKCLLRVAQEIRHLQEAYIHVNLEKDKEKEKEKEKKKVSNDDAKLDSLPKVAKP